MQQFMTQVAFACPNCSVQTSDMVEIPEPDWSAAEDPSELISEGEIVVRCHNCEVSFEAYVFNDAGSCDVTLDDHPETTVFTSEAHFWPPDWPEPDPPTDPRGIFEDHQDELGAWLDTAGQEDPTALINRILFAAVITGLESYLSDTLRKVINERPEALNSFLEKDSDLIKQKFTLVDIVTKPNLVKDTVNKHLREVLYHNLAKVNALYRISVDIDFIQMLGPDRTAELSRAIEYRHHCVHRNGKDLEGNTLTIFTREYIKDIQEKVVALVRSIDAQIDPAL
ncbi:hypothetical protein C3Y94_025925 [Rhizobium ruizarguesonis]|uniref:hypothetical protein n=1 Tax=Rhizobium ruizarguesonis TaxID=2081791 RepID=UPI001639A2C9|nr:hypothetical protein [Rhizobium ruizarguesonis]MBC2806593.1 hypothetical protein [Rhizobium ruizarguesonis]